MTDNNNITNHEFLQDKINGKIQPWNPKKRKSLSLAGSFLRLGYDKKGWRVWWCSNELQFFFSEETGRRILQSARFCKERLCIMCSWRKSIKVFYQVSRVMDRVQLEHDSLVPVFLTLTIRNCRGGELEGQLDEMFKGWGLMIRHRKAKKIIKGYFRALEVTYNKKSNTFHPHFHAILLVDKQYFKSKDYMQTTDWVRMWRTACKLDYDPICDIRKVKTAKGKYKAVAEVAKYTLKDKELIHEDNPDLTDKLVCTLSDALHRRRLYAFGGIMRVIAKQLGINNPEDGDLVNIDEAAIREDVASTLEIYRWDFGLMDYIRR